MTKLPEQPRTRLVPGIFQRIFPPFFSCVWWGSYLLLSGGLDTRLGRSSAERMRASTRVPYHPNDQWLREKEDISTYKGLSCYWITPLRCKSFPGWKDWGSQHHTWDGPRYISSWIHWGEYKGKLLFSTKTNLHESASLRQGIYTLSITTGDLRNESIAINIFKALDHQNIRPKASKQVIASQQYSILEIK